MNVFFAGFWRRLGAYFVDWVILRIAFTPINLYLFMHTDFFSWASEEIPTPPFYVFFLIGFVIWAYWTFFEASKFQATPGKLALGIRVTDIGGQRPNFKKAALRNLGKFISFALLGIGFLMIAFTKNKQGIHDLLAKAWVIKKPDRERVTRKHS